MFSYRVTALQFSSFRFLRQETQSIHSQAANIIVNIINLRCTIKLIVLMELIILWSDMGAHGGPRLDQQVKQFGSFLWSIFSLKWSTKTQKRLHFKDRTF